MASCQYDHLTDDPIAVIAAFESPASARQAAANFAPQARVTRILDEMCAWFDEKERLSVEPAGTPCFAQICSTEAHSAAATLPCRHRATAAEGLVPPPAAHIEARTPAIPSSAMPGATPSVSMGPNQPAPACLVPLSLELRIFSIRGTASTYSPSIHVTPKMEY
ncbi:hypothetical protein BOTBODRAFT_180241 [Botryobasidium botryosum FD-172 SS1]|uniref:Uncharacterized protein n=1 Tax=Botryobasidium botryosum (strain FD-172 SS1) TaxID=930990 RepID=A0A067M804_BOTB1|nr:hypothetical protein BOTBODRAFT_180241 [Botryobasidium botryosum FD-172 SS1]